MNLLGWMSDANLTFDPHTQLTHSLTLAPVLVHLLTPLNAPRPNQQTRPVHPGTPVIIVVEANNVLVPCCSRCAMPFYPDSRPLSLVRPDMNRLRCYDTDDVELRGQERQQWVSSIAMSCFCFFFPPPPLLPFEGGTSLQTRGYLNWWVGII